MPHSDQLKILMDGVVGWNQWRDENRIDEIDFRGNDLKGLNLIDYNLRNGLFCNANLTGAQIVGADLSECNFDNADLMNADLRSAYLWNAVLDDATLLGCNLAEATLNQSHICGSLLSGANLSGATLCYAEICGSDLTGADLSGADLTGADLSDTDLSFADLSQANLSGAILTGARLHKAILKETDLTKAVLVETDISEANLDGARVYGIATWNLITDGATQINLLITKDDEPTITVDDVETAQFIYLLLNNKKLRNVIESVTSKAVLILGRFTEERKKVLDAIRDELRQRNFLPILFDFEKPATRDLTETISILAKLSRFVIADLTDAKSLPHELSHIIPFMPNLPVMPIIVKEQREYGMFEHWKPYPWVLPIYEYDDEAHLIATLLDGVIEPAEKKVHEIRNK